MIDLQEVFCSPACLSGVVFTSALVGNCLSCTGLVCVCAAFLHIHLSARDVQNLYHDLSQEGENPKGDSNGICTVKISTKIMHNFGQDFIIAVPNLLVLGLCVPVHGGCKGVHTFPSLFLCVCV